MCMCFSSPLLTHTSVVTCNDLWRWVFVIRQHPQIISTGITQHQTDLGEPSKIFLQSKGTQQTIYPLSQENHDNNTQHNVKRQSSKDISHSTEVKNHMSALYICEARAGALSVHLAGLGIVSTSLCRFLSCRYVTSLRLSIWCCSPVRMGVDPSFVLSFQLYGMSGACMMSSA